MKVLLIGEYSSLHWNLAKGLRSLGYSVTVASDGDGFKSNPRDIDLLRKSSGIKDTFSAIINIYKNFKNFKGYDIVQLINPCFTTLNVEFNKDLYHRLKKKNDKIYLGAFGDDSYWLKSCLDKKTFRYSEFYFDGKENNLSDNHRLKKLWLNSKREQLNREITSTCDGIIACLCEYYMSYQNEFKNKLTYIPLPFDCRTIAPTILDIKVDAKLKYFLGINKARSEFKGTDKFYNVLEQIKLDCPNEVDSTVVKSLSYADYVKRMQTSDVVLDQLYSYSPAMNGLLAMSMGKILVSGAEPEMYSLLNEKENNPIINVFPSEEDIYNKLTCLLKNKTNLSQLSSDSRAFVEKHHDHIKVAKQYLDFWTK